MYENLYLGKRRSRQLRMTKLLLGPKTSITRRQICHSLLIWL